MRKIKILQTVTSVQGNKPFEKMLMDVCQQIQDMGYEVDIKYAIENTSVHSALVIGYSYEGVSVNTNASVLSETEETQLNTILTPNS